MTGFMAELIHPSQVNTANVISGLEIQSEQNPAITLVTKNGSQQMMNTPITVPRVFAAFVSLENLASLFDTLPPFLFCLTGYPGEDEQSDSTEGNFRSSFFFTAFPPPPLHPPL